MMTHCLRCLRMSALHRSTGARSATQLADLDADRRGHRRRLSVLERPLSVCGVPCAHENTKAFPPLLPINRHYLRKTDSADIADTIPLAARQDLDGAVHGISSRSAAA